MITIKQYKYYITIKKFLPLFLQLYKDKNSKLLKRNLKKLTKNQDYRLLVAFKNNKAIAMASINHGFLLYIGKYLQISNLYVDQNHRNLGIAKLLLKKSELLAKKQQCNIITLNSYLDNATAHDIYTKEGFEAKTYNFIKKITND